MYRIMMAATFMFLVVVPAFASGGYHYPGTIHASRTTQLAFRVGGPLVQVNVDGGIIVEKGQLLMQIDTRDFKDNIAVLKAQLEGLKAQQLLAKRNFERAETLFNQQVSASADFDRAKGAFDAAFSGVRSLEAQLQIAQHRLQDTSLKAPYSGVVIKRMVENHEMISSGKVVLELQDTSELEVEIRVPESEIVSHVLKKGEKAQFELSTMPGKKFDVQLKKWNSAADPITRTYALRFSFPAPKNLQILPGMTADVFYSCAD